MRPNLEHAAEAAISLIDLLSARISNMEDGGDNPPVIGGESYFLAKVVADNLRDAVASKLSESAG